MRILTVHPGPAFSVADVHDGLVEALRGLGHQVGVYNLNDRLDFYSGALFEVGREPDGTSRLRRAVDAETAKQLAANGLLSACYQFWPDVVLVVSAFFVPAEMLDLLRSRGHKVVLYHTESPYEDQVQLRRAAYADLNLLNDPTNLDRFRDVAPAAYLPHAYRPAVHAPGPAAAELVCDLTFVGTGYDSRITFFEAMDLSGLDVVLAGNWTQLSPGSPLAPFVAHGTDECLDNTRAADLYRSARCGLNLYRREAETPGQVQGWAMGPREVEMAACGLFFLRDPRGEGDEVLDMLPTFATPQEAGEQLRYWLRRPDERAALATKARSAIADRTFTRNAATLLRLLDKE